ncbi:MAG: Calx-beta domain-containing protein [Syntrophobacteraceae bacterium]
MKRKSLFGRGRPGTRVMVSAMVIAWLALAACFDAVVVHAATIYIPSDYATIQDGIDAAVDGDSVVVSDGIYAGFGNVDLDSHGKQITLRSENGAAHTIIDCQTALGTRAFYLHTGETASTVLDGFTIANGKVADNGGAVLIRGTSPTIRNCIFTGNNAANGGAISIEGASASRIQNCVIVKNSATGSTSKHGGGVYVYSDDGTTAADVTILNCTIADNTAGTTAGAGGGVYVEAAAGSAAGTAIEVSNTIFNNSPDDLIPSATTADVTVSTANNLFGDPSFKDGLNGDYHLTADSVSCIDMGDNAAASALSHDVEGNARSVDGDGDSTSTVDVGAYEYDVHSLQVDFDVDQTSIRAGGTVAFTDTTTGDTSGATYLWDFDADNPGTDTSTVQNPSHTYPAEGEYSVQLTVTNVSGASGTRTRHHYISVLPPLATVTIAATDGTASEEAVPTTGVFTVTRSVASAFPLEVSYTIGGTAMNGVDYTSLTGKVTINANQTTGVITITPKQDTLLEGNETVILTVKDNPTSHLVGTPNAATVIVSDDDSPSVLVKIEATDAIATETSKTTGMFTVTRTGGDNSTPLSVRITPSGTALAPTDYTRLPTTVTIPAGSDTVTTPVTPVDDTLFEGDETVVATIGPNLSAYSIDPASGSATVTITDNDKPSVSVIAKDPRAKENSASQPADAGVFTISRTGPAVIAGDLTVNYAISGTATNGTDCVRLAGTVVIPGDKASVEVIVTPLDDLLVESDETVILTVSADPAYVVGTGAKATVTLSDNDLPVVGVLASDPVASEAGQSQGKVTFYRTGKTSSQLIVYYSTTGSTANPKSDMTSLAGSVRFAANASVASLMITPVDDALQEGDETIQITVNPGTSYTVDDTGSTAAVTIRDNDVPKVSVSASGPNAQESGSPIDGKFTITRDGPDDLGHPLTVYYALSGTAINGVDYSALTGQITLNAAVKAVDVTITPVDDTIVEGAETAVLTIIGSDAYKVDDKLAAATVKIADDEKPTVSIVATDSHASEADLSSGLFTLSRVGSNTEALTVKLSLAGSTATNGADYTTIPASVQIPAKSSSAVIRVKPIKDSATDPEEIVRLTVVPDSTYAVAVGAGDATVVIH